MSNAIYEHDVLVGPAGEEELGAAASASAVSWSAVFAGAVAAVAVTLILVELGAGLGLASISTRGTIGATLATAGVAGGIWLIVVQWLASGVGGYLAGRLRTKWVGVHTDEVFFRDTAHGFLAWSAATLIGVTIVAAAASSAISAGGQIAGGVASGTAQIAAGAVSRNSAEPASVFDDPYYVDLLFRPGNPATAGSTGQSGDGTNAAPSTAPAQAQTQTVATSNAAMPTPSSSPGVPANTRNEATRILARDLVRGDLTPDDRAYLTQLIATNTGLSQADAAKRVDDVVAQVKGAEAQAQQAAEKARKAAASASIIGALAMVVGAFIASVSAALGGKLRDEF
jgi:hypothetical protein